MCGSMFGRAVGADRATQNKRFCFSKARRNLELGRLQGRVRGGECWEEAGWGVGSGLAGVPSRPWEEQGRDQRAERQQK